MFGNDFFGRREDRQNETQILDEAGTSGQGPGSQHFGNNPQSCFQNANWNGLSPRNKTNQLHYKRVREQAPPDYESDEWPDSDIEPAAPLVRKRLGSPQLANDHSAKRTRGQLDRIEIFTPQHQRAPHPARTNRSFQDRQLIERGSQQYQQPNTPLARYSHTEFQLPPPFETNARSSSWLGPDIPGGEEWGSGRGGIGQIFPRTVSRQQQDFCRERSFRGHNHNDPIFISGGSGGIRDSLYRQRGMTLVPNAFRDSPFRQRGITIAADSRQGYRAQQTINLTTPESVHERRNATQPSTSSGSSRLRRVTETEPTDLDIDGGHRSSPAFAQGSFLRQPFNVPSTSHSYNVPTVPQFGQYIKTEDNYGHNTPFRGVSRQPAYNNLHRSGCKTAQRQIASGQDPESDENDTIEEVIRKKAWSRKVKAADNASPRVKLSKTLEFGSSRRSASGYSSQEVETNSKVREERQKHTLSRIRAPEFASKSSKESSLPHLSTLLVKDVPSRHVVMKQTAAQKAVALEKEKAELRRQQVAEETIAQRQQRAQELKGIDYLFEEVPVDQAALARIKKSKALDKARKYASEEAKIVEESDKTTQEKLAALRKQRAAEGLEEKKAEKKQRIEEQRQLEKKREEERLDAKRVSAVEMLRTKRVVEEEKRLEDLDKLEAEKQAAKKLAATLQSFKKPDSKPSSAGTAIQHKEPETAQDSGNLSDGGMFVLDDVVPLDNEEATEQYVTPADEGIIDKPARIQKPGTVVNDADVTLKELVTDVQKSETTKPDGHAAAASTYVQDSETVTDQPGATSTTVISEVQIYETIADKTYGHSTAALSSTQNPETVTDDGKVSQIVAASSAEKPEIVTKTQIPATLVSGTSISAVASDGRRRPPEISRPRVARRTSPDPIRFTGGRAAARDIQDSDHATASTTSHAHKKSQNRRADKGESQTQAKLQKTLKEVEKLKAKVKAEEGERKKEWDALMKQLGAMLTPQDREDIASRNQRNRPGKSQNLASEAREPHPTGKDSQLLSLTSQINFVSRIESQAKEKEKAEAARLAKYEKDKATCRRRYDREIRIVLNGQGIEPDDEKVSKQVDEKMVLWEENRRKKERREFGGKDLCAEQELTSPPTLQNTDDEGTKDPELQKVQEREQAIRAGVEFLASQNKAGSDFNKAASKLRTQDLESDESEEDPDDEPEAQTAPVAIVEEPEEMAETEVDETLNPATFNTSIIPPLPEIPESLVAQSKTAFLPDIVNPREEDIMHSYSVRHRAEREKNVYDCVVLNSFHNLKEANAFAQQKLSEFELGPSTGKSETHDEDNLYLGKVIYDKIKDHSETVWVTREIVYIGDTANIRHGDVKATIVPKVFNVVQVLQGEDGIHVGSVVTTASIKTLANKMAADHFLSLSKPSRPRMDSMTYYNDTVVPLVRQSIEHAEAQDVTVEFEGHISETERFFTISISENPVVGPLN